MHWETKNRQRRQHCRKFSGRRHKNIQGVSNSSNVRKDVVAKFEEENARHNANSFVFMSGVSEASEMQGPCRGHSVERWAERDAPHGCADKFRQTPWCKSTDRDCPDAGCEAVARDTKEQVEHVVDDHVDLACSGIGSGRGGATPTFLRGAPRMLSLVQAPLQWQDVQERSLGWTGAQSQLDL